MKPPRLPWQTFPDVLIHASESAVKQQPDYQAATALTGKSHSAKLSVTKQRLAELRCKHGDKLEHWWQQRFAHAFDSLTESEARYLVRTSDIDTVRNRIAAQEQTGNC